MNNSLSESSFEKQPWLESTWHKLNGFSSKNWTILLPGAMAALIRLTLIPLMGVPYPGTHDEFAYLLGADTFSHGRLTNPTHPLWRFFETIHVISIPSYAPKYPPGQAFFLAIGERLFSHPFFGCVLVCFLFVSAVVWMLRVWVPPGMALIGGFFSAITFGTGNYWIESYWGGAVGATGVALALGAMGRIRKRGQFVLAWALSVGIVLIWFTRPFEGAFFVLAVIVLLFLDVLRRRLPRAGDWEASRWWSFVSILLGIACATSAFQAYYDFRVTGHVALLPYVLHHEQYEFAPLLWFQRPQTPTLESNPTISEFYQEWALQRYQERRDFMTGKSSRAKALKAMLAPREMKDRMKVLELAIAVPMILVLSFLLRRDRRVRELWFILLISSVPLILESYTMAHYMVAVTVTLLALIICLVWLLHEQIWRTSWAGTFVAGLITAALFCGAAGNNAFRAWRLVKRPFPFIVNRARVERELIERGGTHLLLVRYSPDHDTNLEWVYNLADIDTSKIIWARDLGTDQNKQLINYYKGRNFWLLDADSQYPEPVPYQP